MKVSAQLTALSFVRPRWLALALAVATGTALVRAGIGEPSYVKFTAPANGLVLVQNKQGPILEADEADWPGVWRAIGDLQADFERVAGLRPPLLRTAAAMPPPATAPTAAAAGSAAPNAPSAPTPILIGTVGRSRLIDALASAGKLDVSPIRGRWESWITEVVEHPVEGIERALVIAGSDKRGTIFGVYDLSQQLGVSPWYWWADVVPEKREAIFVTPGQRVFGEPSVKYRGIFLNDEAPDLSNWVLAKFGAVTPGANPPIPAGVANYGSEFYRRIFEVMLRLRANYLWPAMWNNAFNEDDPNNAKLADEYGIVMGTSHQEPMLRAQKEWDRRYRESLGSWNYAQNPKELEEFWREGVRRNRAFESVVTLGLRGANDTEMAPGGPEANRAMLEHIVEVQRRILADEINPDLRRVPQLWCLYKEVQDYYDAGMRVPDDVTLLWADDNWGNLRRLPTEAERRRPGGAGVYYHFDYHGGPRSYQWLNTNPLPKIWEQMSLAKRYGADRIWIVNVGHFKGYEVPTEFFLSLAWRTDRWTADNVNDFLGYWALREFGRAQAGEIGALVARYAKYNGRRKPEMLAPGTFSLVDYGEAERVLLEFSDAIERANRVFRALPEPKRDAFYELVLFPTVASGIVNELYVAAGRNALYATQGRASTEAQASKVNECFQQYVALVNHFHRKLAGGKWDHFMDQPILGYTTWRDPPANSLQHLTLAKPAANPNAGLGVAIEGSTSAWPGPTTTARLPVFDSVNAPRRWFEVFNRGTKPFDATIAVSAPWILATLTDSTGAPRTTADGPLQAAIGPDTRVAVTIDWTRAGSADNSGTITVSGAGASVAVEVTAVRADVTAREAPGTFIENAGVIAIEPAHAQRNTPGAAGKWVQIADYGRTLSGMRAESESPEALAEPAVNAPVLEYDVVLNTPGEVEVIAITAPTLNFLPGRPLRYAVAFDDGPPHVVTLVPASYRADHRNSDWEKVVGDNARYSPSRHTLTAPGKHTLKVWMVDPAVVLQKLILHHGTLNPSYLGPPETALAAQR